MKIESLNKTKGPDFDTLKKNKVPLTEDERKEVFEKDAVWHTGSSKDPNTGRKVKKVSAIWKSVIKGETYYGCNTHRAWNVRRSLSAAINLFHSFIKSTASMTKSLSSSYTGYRTEALYGEGYRDLREVVEHETYELGNEDILDYNKITTREELDAFIKSLYERGYTECIWLCDSIDDLYHTYLERDKEEYPSLEELKKDPEKYGVNKITIQNPIIIDDIGQDGKLIAYKPY